MGFINELKRLARPYEDEMEDDFEEEFDMPRAAGPRANELERRNKVVNIHTTTQLQVVLVKPERFENASTPTRAPSKRWLCPLTSSRPTTWRSWAT